MIVLYSNQNNAQARDTDVSPTLPAAMGMGGGYIPMIVSSYGFKPSQGEKAHGIGFEVERAPTLNTSDSCGGGVLIVREDDREDIHREEIL